jgi:hypothetical protein
MSSPETSANLSATHPESKNIIRKTGDQTKLNTVDAARIGPSAQKISMADYHRATEGVGPDNG